MKVARCVGHRDTLRATSLSLHHRGKGYLCCKRRVLEFDEFLKIEGCKKGRHVFVPKAKANAVRSCGVPCFVQDPKRSGNGAAAGAIYAVQD